MTYLVHQGKVMNEKKTIEETTLKQKLRLKCPSDCWEDWI